MPADFAETVAPHLEAELEPGETVHGIVAATQQKTFSGQLYAVAATDRRLLLLPLDRRLSPKGPARSIKAETLRSSKAGGAGGGWWSAGSAALDAAAIKLELKTTDGEKVKLMLMSGSGALGALGGGESQRQGVEALADWFRRSAEE